MNRLQMDRHCKHISFTDGWAWSAGGGNLEINSAKDTVKHYTFTTPNELPNNGVCVFDAYPTLTESRKVRMARLRLVGQSLQKEQPLLLSGFKCRGKLRRASEESGSEARKWRV